MADAGQIKTPLDKVLSCVEMVSSFASTIYPIFGVVSSLVKVARKGLVDDKAHTLDKDFQVIHNNLESISENNHEILKTIRIDEVNETYGKYEERIKHQYAAFAIMVAQVKKDPDNAERHMKTFQEVYERDQSDVSLDVYYRGVMGTQTLFGKPLLMVYLDSCDCDRKIMEHRCSHIAHLFEIGLIALMAYTTVTEDDKDEVREKWAKRAEEIQEKMEEVLSQCKDKSS